MSGLRVGIDLVQLSRVAESLATFGDRFLTRVFTTDEVAYATAAPAETVPRLAARLAAKEAAKKALSTEGIGWRDIEVRRAPSGAPSLRLHGGAAAGARCGSRGEPEPRRRLRHRCGSDAPPTGPEPNAMTDKIRNILKDHGRLSKDAMTIADDADLYQAGLTSHASVNVMLALEGEFEVEFPDHMLKRSVFESIAAMRTALTELTASA